MSFLTKITGDGKAKSSSDYILALDIGTEYVKTLIAKKGKNHQLEIVGVGREHELEGNIFGGAIANIPNVIKVCEEALTSVAVISALIPLAVTKLKLEIIGRSAKT